jgi:hypothetical protein
VRDALSTVNPLRVWATRMAACAATEAGLSDPCGSVGSVRDRPDLQNHGCGRCGARWFGLDRAHCTACRTHQTFDDVELFDAHRRDGTCLPPSRLGLVRNKGGIWQRRVRRLRAVS